MNRMLWFLMMLCFGLVMGLQAQVYVETHSMGSITTKTWTIADKQREETAFSLNENGESLMQDMGHNLTRGLGDTVKIKRLDKGVEWTLYPDRKQYTELPLAVPHSDDAELSVIPSDDDVETENQRMSEMKLRKVPQKRTIAGIECYGVEMLFDGKVQQRIWMAPTSNPLVKKVMEQTESFDQKLLKAQYGTWAKDRFEKVQNAWKLLENVFGTADVGKEFSEGFPVLVEMVEESAPGPLVVLEVKSMNDQSISPDLFDIPAGYKLTTESALHEELIQGMMKLHSTPPTEE